MSMIQCPECGHEVSSKASECPECGVRIAGNVKRCPVCNAFVLMGASECPNCHTQFVVPATTPEQPKEDRHEEEKTAPKQPKRRGGFLWKLAVCAALVAGCFLLYLWIEHVEEEDKADAAFALLERCNDPQNFHDFLQRYADSEHVPAVEARIKALEKEEKEWQQAQKSLNLAQMKQFFATYPTSIHRQAAMHYIDSLEWCAVSALGTSAAYTAYITNHDNGDYITQAFAARDSALRSEQQARRDSIAAAAAAARADSTVLEAAPTL